MNVDTEVLRWFQQVADGYTVTEVADLSMVSQPGVSRALTRLEREIGTPLLERSGRVLRTTHAGRVFKRHVDRVVHQLDDGIAAVSQLVDPETGTVTVAFQLSLGTWLIPRIVRSFHAQHPGVEFRLEQSRDVLGSSMVVGGQVDVELTSRRPRHPGVSWQRLFTEQLYLALPPRHPASASARVDLAEVADDDFVLLQPDWGLRRLTDELCATAGFTPHVVFEGDDLPTLAALVGAGLGVAIVPAMGADLTAPRPGEPRLVPLADDGAFRDIGLTWSADRRLLPSPVLFRDHVLAGGEAWLEG
jgi:LysR family transcriptional regulator, transcription activator of glutamate synthase operon